MLTAEVATLKHIARVKELLDHAANDLRRRGTVHDLSKFSPEEMGPLQAIQDLINKEGHAPYGSEEYKRRTDFLKPMLDHHYANNSHHPEHYPNGVDGMCLFDIMEMFFDWKAASERGQESSMGISHSVKRFNISPQLESILRNTADRLGYKVD
jgi:hypothetical protein